MLKLMRFFALSAAFILVTTGVAKIISGFGSHPILKLSDPLFRIPFRYVFWSAGIIELGIAAVLLFSRRILVQCNLVAWLGTGFLIYRIGVWWVGWVRPCNCMGNLTDSLHIAPETADTAMKIILAYLLIGSYALVGFLWNEKRKRVVSV